MSDVIRMALEQQRQPTVAILRALSELDLEDIHIINRSTARDVLTDQREQLLEEIGRGDVESVRDLARRTERNVSIVSRDLEVLFEADLIDFEENGRAKKPVLAHENVLVKPIVFDGSVTTSGE